MKSTTVEYVLKASGGATRRKIIDEDLVITDEAIQSIVTNISVTVRNIAPPPSIKYGPLSLSVKSSKVGVGPWCVWTVPVSVLTLRTSFAVYEGDILCPDFGTANLMETIWSPPAGMRLFMLISTRYNQSVPELGSCYYFALDNRNATWRLPLPNVYDTCEICHGNTISSETQLGMVGRFIHVMESSPWNRDLIGDADRTTGLFRFKLHETNGLVQQPPLKDWNNLCQSVSVSYINNNMIV